MKRIKDIINALKVISNAPSKTIRDAWSIVSTMAITEPAQDNETARAVTLVNNIMQAVVAIAEDMEKPAKAEGEAAK